jgi:hypothetical protein
MSDPTDPAIPLDEPAPEAPVEDAPAEDKEPSPSPSGIAPQEAQPPGAEVVALDTTAAVQGTALGEDATIAVKHDNGATFFHSLNTLPRRFLNEAGDVIFGRHLNVTPEEAETPRSPEPPAPAEEPAS